VRPASVSTRVFGGAVDQLLAQLRLQPLQSQRDGGLRAQQPFRGAREALLGGYRQENLERVQFHAFPA
jgi:hypothetical protein